MSRRVWGALLAVVPVASPVAAGTDDAPAPRVVAVHGRVLLEDSPGALPPVGDQGISTTCVAWATSHAYSAWRRLLTDPSADLSDPAARGSPAYLYNLEMRVAAGCTSPDRDPRPSTLDPDRVLDDVPLVGLAPERLAPYTTDCRRRPTAQAVEAAAASRDALAFVGVDPQDGRSRWHTVEFGAMTPAFGDADRLRAAALPSLERGGPAVALLDVFDDFARCGVGDTYEPAAMGHGYLGKHALLLTGFDPAHAWTSRSFDGSVRDRTGPAWRFMNSWGRSWADHGSVWIPEETLFGTGESPSAFGNDPRSLLLSLYVLDPPATPFAAATARALVAPTDCLPAPRLWRAPTDAPEAAWEPVDADCCRQDCRPTVGGEGRPGGADSEEVPLYADVVEVPLTAPAIPIVPSLADATIDLFVDGCPLDCLDAESLGVRFERVAARPGARKEIGVRDVRYVAHVIDRARMPERLVVYLAVDFADGRPFARRLFTLRKSATPMPR